jgi:hypothetical protein
LFYDGKMDGMTGYIEKTDMRIAAGGGEENDGTGYRPVSELWSYPSGRGWWKTDGMAL